MHKVIAREKSDKKIAKFQHQLAFYTGKLTNLSEKEQKLLDSAVKPYNNEDYIRISEHQINKYNVDLRKLRSIENFYLTSNGRLSNNKLKYRYTNDCLQADDYLKDCNDRVNAMRDDLSSSGLRDEPNSEGIYESLDREYADEISGEEYVDFMDQLERNDELMDVMLDIYDLQK